MIEITLQYFDGCPNWRVTDAHLRTIMGEQPASVTVRHQLIDTQEAAEEHGFRGSPTVLVDGIDPFADPDAPVGLSCRIYLSEHGMAGSPSLEQLRDALAGASTS